MAVQLVTGGAGFIGSHLVDALLQHGEDVVVVDDLSRGSLENMAPQAQLYPVDIADRQLLEKVFHSYEFETVYHLAALINTSVLTEQPLVDVRTSVLGTINLAELCLAHGVRRLVYASSVGVYGRPAQLPATEDFPLAPVYSYAIAKACAEQYLDFYAKTHGLAYHGLRYANVYGPRQPIYGEVGVMAIFTERLRLSRDLTVFGDGEHVRDFIYVSDAVEATVRSATVPGNLTLNIASGQGATVNELVGAFRAHVGDTFHIERRPERVGELGKFICDISKAQQCLGWRPEVDLHHGIGNTLGYYGVI